MVGSREKEDQSWIKAMVVWDRRRETLFRLQIQGPGTKVFLPRGQFAYPICLFVHTSACSSAVGLVNIGSKERRRKLLQMNEIWYEYGDFPSRRVRWSSSPTGIKSQSRDSLVSLTSIKLSQSPYSCLVSGKKISSTCSFVESVKWGESEFDNYLPLPLSTECPYSLVSLC